MFGPCKREGCSNVAEEGKSECFRHRVASVGFGLKAPAVDGQWHRTKNEWMQENLGTTDDRELGKRGIERAT
jgi:hypothetical protein